MRLDMRLSVNAEHALRVVIKHEGGLTTDHAGLTNYGICLKTLQASGDLDFDLDHDGELTAADLRSLTPEDAMAYYYRHWWMRYGYDRIKDVLVATKTFDLAVNMGSVQAHKLLQRGLRACGVPGVVDDGVIGPITLAAVASVDARVLLAAVRGEAAGWYRALVYRRQEARRRDGSLPDYYPYLAGWLNRAYS